MLARRGQVLGMQSEPAAVEQVQKSHPVVRVGRGSNMGFWGRKR